MKINKFIGLLACTMAFTACQNDMLEGDVQQNKIYTLSGQMTTGKVMSRAQIALGNNNPAEEVAFWNEGDQFVLFQKISGNLNSSTFTISGGYSETGENRQSATFTTDTPAQSGKYIAIYPSSVRLEGNSVKMEFQNELDFTSASTAEERANVWKEYMTNNMFMIADGALTGDGTDAVSFRHLCALARVTYTNATAETQNINNVNLGGDQNFTFAWSYNVEGGYQDGGSSTNGYTLRTHGLTVEPGESTDLYLFFFPHEFNLDGEMHLNMNTNSGHKGVRLATAAIQAANGGANGFEAGKRYWFKVTESPLGFVWSKEFSMDEGENVTFANKAFSLALLNVLGDALVTLNEDSCAVMKDYYVKSIKKLDFNSYEERKNITSLEGIELFENLEELYCNDAGLTELKLTNNKLWNVRVEGNRLTSLDVSGLSNLLELSCAFNGDLQDNINIEGTNLKVFRFQHTNATKIPEGLWSFRLRILDSGDNKLTELNLSEFTVLTELYLARNLLSTETLTLPSNNLLEILDISGNENITSFDMTQYPNLRYFWAGSNELETLDPSQCTSLEFLSCHDNLLSELDLSANPKVYSLECGSQKNEINLALTLTESQKAKWDESWATRNTNVTVNVTDTPAVALVTIENPELAVALQGVLGSAKVIIDENGYGIMKESDVLATKDLNFGWKQYTISSLKGIEHFINLQSLYCNYSNLSECDLSKNKALCDVVVCGSLLSTLDLSGLAELKYVGCAYSETLKELVLDGCTKVGHIECMRTQLETLNIPNPENIWQLICNDNPNLKLDLNLYPNLTTLGLENMGLTELDIPENIRPKLTYLTVGRNQLSSVDLSEYPALEIFACEYNNLTSLNLSAVPGLWMLKCSGNKLSTLDITSLSKLEDFTCGEQQDDINLTLTLTATQKTTWDSKWASNNANVTLNVVSEGNAGGGVAVSE